jgi:hypothetical protein
MAGQVQRAGAVVDAHPVTDPQAGSGDERVGGGQQLLALGDGGGQHWEFGVEFARVDALDQCLDAGGGGVRPAGWRRGGWRHRGEGTPRAAGAAAHDGQHAPSGAGALRTGGGR